MTQQLPVAIIGGGAVGLSAVAHLLERGETPILFESNEIGANMLNWSHVRMFSAWQYNIDKASARLLESHGWTMPDPDELPTGGDMVNRYMKPFAELPDVAPYIHTNTRVLAISRRHVDKMKDAGRDDAPFILHVVDGDGNENLIEARAVIDASGTWQNPNPIGANGLKAIGEAKHRDNIYYGIPDIAGMDQPRYANKCVMVVGNGHSAMNALIALTKLQEAAPQTEIYWVMRSKPNNILYGGGADDALPARGELGSTMQRLVDNGQVVILAPFRVQKVETIDDKMFVTGATDGNDKTVRVDEIISATGSRPDLEMLRELRLDIDPSLESIKQLAPLIDPNLHSCGTVRPHGEAELRHPESNFYIVGMKSYGRAPTFLLATGYEQVRSVVAGLVGDWDAARDVQLDLPETGVCVSDIDDGLDNACCAPASVGTVNISTISIGEIGTGANLIDITPTKSNNSCC